MTIMIMKDLKRQIVEKLGDRFSQKDVEDVYNAFVECLYEETEQETTMSIQIPKIGILKTSMKAAYTAKNPMTGEPVEVPETRSARITVCKALKDKVKEGAEGGKKKASKKSAPATKKTAKKETAKKAPAKKVAKKVVKKK